MSALSIQPTYPIFTETDGQPLENGYIWIGTVNLDPQVNPINVYWDASLTQLAAQPIRTECGYPVNNGTPARLYVNSDYSIRVMNKNGSVVYSAPEALERYSGIVISELSGSEVSFLQSGAGAVQTDIQTKAREWVSPHDFGAVGDADASGVFGTNDSAAFALLEAAFTGVAVNLQGKIYLVNSPIPHANQYFNGSFVVAAATTDDQPVLAAFGRDSLKSNTFVPRQFPSSTLTWAAGNYNTAFGADTMVNNTTGRRNTAIGANAFNQNSAGFYNTVVGAWAAYSNTIGNYNTVVGNQSLQYNTIGNNNTVVGEGSLVASVSGSNNVVIGDTAAVSVASGNRNIAIGSQALKTTTFALNDTIAIGYQALSYTVTGSLNLAIGNYTLGANTSGSNNLAIGHQTLANNSTASDNIAIGVQALNACTDSPRNTAVGKVALSSITTGTLQNTAVGYSALAALTTGGNNTAIGANAGSGITTFDNTTSVGYNAQPTASNEVKLGDTNVQTINLGNGLKIDIASILAAPAGTPIVVRVSGGIKYISV